jgi:hypothetical protein
MIGFLVVAGWPPSDRPVGGRTPPFAGPLVVGRGPLFGEGFVAGIVVGSRGVSFRAGGILVTGRKFPAGRVEVTGRLELGGELMGRDCAGAATRGAGMLAGGGGVRRFCANDSVLNHPIPHSAKLVNNVLFMFVSPTGVCSD